MLKALVQHPVGNFLAHLFLAVTEPAPPKEEAKTIECEEWEVK